MFNVCPGCGEYTDRKEVSSSLDKALCPTCKYEHPFISLPLFVVTGASGSGKTTAALKLMQRTHAFVVLDQDILWTDAFNSPENDYQIFRNTWLRMIKNIHQAGKSVVLFGTAIPEQYEGCVERRYLNCINYLALTCEASELERRLTDRPNWRQSGSPENVQRMVEFNQWLIENASQTKPKMQILNTTGITIDQTVDEITAWLNREFQSKMA